MKPEHPEVFFFWDVENHRITENDDDDADADDDPADGQARRDEQIGDNHVADVADDDVDTAQPDNEEHAVLGFDAEFMWDQVANDRKPQKDAQAEQKESKSSSSSSSDSSSTAPAESDHADKDKDGAKDEKSDLIRGGGGEDKDP